MLTSRGTRRRNIGIYSIGLLAGASASGVVVWVLSGLLSPLPHAARALLVAACVVAAVARDLRLIAFTLPENRRLVPERVFEHGVGRGALQFGFEMGTGVRTYVPSTTPYLLVIALTMLGAGPSSIALAALGFSTGRASVPWLRTVFLDPVQWERRAGAASAAVIRVAAVEFAVLIVILLGTS